MGLVVARPQSPGELLDLAFAVAKRHAGTLLSLGAVPLCAALAADLGLRLVGRTPTAEILTAVPVFVCFGIAEARMISAASLLLHAQPVTATAVRAQVRRHWGAVVVGYSLKWILALIGFALLVVPGVLVLLLCFAVPTVTVLEGRGVWGSMRRSATLARGHKKRLLATVGFLDLAAAAFAIGFAAIFSEPATGQLPVWATLTNWAVTVALVPVQATLMVAVYTDILIRQEGYDVEAAARDLRGAA